MSFKDALESMVWQFAYRSINKKNQSILYTGGLSALEEAFESLDWDDPHIVEDFDGGICDVKGCAGWVEAQGGMWPEKGYWCLCSKHAKDYRDGKPQPKMKKRAVERENARDDNGELPLNFTPSNKE